MKKSTQSTIYALLLCMINMIILPIPGETVDIFSDPSTSHSRTATDLLQEFVESKNDQANRIREENALDERVKQEKLNTWNNRHWTTKAAHRVYRFFSDAGTVNQALDGNPQALEELKKTIKNLPKNDPKINGLQAIIIKDLTQQHNTLTRELNGLRDNEQRNRIQSKQRVLRKNAVDLLQSFNDTHIFTDITFDKNTVQITTREGETFTYNSNTGVQKSRPNTFAPTPSKPLSPEQFKTELTRLKIPTDHILDYYIVSKLDSASKMLLIENAQDLLPEDRLMFIQKVIDKVKDNISLSEQNRQNPETLIDEAYEDTSNRAAEQRKSAQPFGQSQARGLAPAQLSGIQSEPVTKVIIPDTKSASTRQSVAQHRGETRSVDIQRDLPIPLSRQDVVKEQPARSATLANQPRSVSLQPQAARDQFQTDLSSLEIPETLIKSDVLTSLDRASKELLIQAVRSLAPELRTKFVETFITFATDRQKIGTPTQELIDSASRKIVSERFSGDIPDYEVQPNIPAISHSLAPEAPLTQEQFKATLSTLEIPEPLIDSLLGTKLDSVSMRRLIDQAQKIDVPETRNLFISKFILLALEDKTNTPETIQKNIQDAFTEALHDALQRASEKKAADELRAERAREQKKWDEANAKNAALLQQYSSTQHSDVPASSSSKDLFAQKSLSEFEKMLAEFES